jgi:hypothetical protein
MIHTTTLPEVQRGIYQEILSIFSIPYIINNQSVSVKYSSVNEAETIWALFVERFNQIISE